MEYTCYILVIVAMAAAVMVVLVANMVHIVANTVVDLSQSDRIHSWRVGILFVVGEVHSNSFSSSTILL